MNYSKVLNIVLALAVLVFVLKMSMERGYEAQESDTAPLQERVSSPTVASTIEIIHQRKSVRHFTDQKVSKEQLETLVKAAMAAPTAVNQQPWDFIIVDDKETLMQLGEKLPYAQMAKQAQGAIIVCGNMNETLEGEGQAYWIQDCSAATQNLLLAAESLGLGAVWTGVYPKAEREQIVKEILNLPDYIIPLNVIPIGYPTGQDKPKNKWKPDKVHWNRW